MAGPGGISLQVLGAVRELNNAAISLGNGDDVKRLSIQWQEAQAVGAAMQQASVCHYERLNFWPSTMP